MIYLLNNRSAARFYLIHLLATFFGRRDMSCNERASQLWQSLLSLIMHLLFRQLDTFSSFFVPTENNYIKKTTKATNHNYNRVSFTINSSKNRVKPGELQKTEWKYSEPSYICSDGSICVYICLEPSYICSLWLFRTKFYIVGFSNVNLKKIFLNYHWFKAVENC